MTYSSEGLIEAERARDEAIRRLEATRLNYEAKMQEMDALLNKQKEKERKIEEQKEIQRLARAGFTGKDAKQKASAAKAESEFRASLANIAKQYEQRIATTPNIGFGNIGAIRPNTKEGRAAIEEHKRQYAEFRADQKKPKAERQYDRTGRKILSAEDKRELEMIKDFERISNQPGVPESIKRPKIQSMPGFRVFDPEIRSIAEFERKYAPSPAIDPASQGTTPIPEGAPATGAKTGVQYNPSTPIQLNAPAGAAGMAYQDLLNKLREYNKDKYARGARKIIPSNARRVGRGGQY